MGNALKWWAAMLVLAACSPLVGAELVSGEQFTQTQGQAPVLRVITIDVTTREVGDAHLIISPAGKTMLIDTAMPGYGEQVILPFLKQQGIAHLDWIMASHMHDDHFGSIPELVLSDQISVGAVVWSPLPYEMMDQHESMYAADPQRIMKEIIAACDRKQVPIQDVLAGQIIDLGGEATGEILAAANPQMIVGNYVNNNSIIMMLRYGDFSMMFTGDQGFEQEQRVLALGRDLTCDVLKIGHHAGAGSTGEDWIAALGPKVGIAPMPEYLSNDPRGQRVFDQLMPTGMRLFRSWECGHIEIRADGKRFTVLTQKPTTNPVIP